VVVEAEAGYTAGLPGMTIVGPPDHLDLGIALYSQKVFVIRTIQQRIQRPILLLTTTDTTERGRTPKIYKNEPLSSRGKIRFFNFRTDTKYLLI
jgi:hypothetical protein